MSNHIKIMSPIAVFSLPFEYRLYSSFQKLKVFVMVMIMRTFKF